MNHQYQHKKGPPKMFKDLKYGKNACLRQSLLDIAEIQNMNKIFIGRKEHYKISEADTQIQPKQAQQDFVMKQIMYTSPEQNLELIKKQRIANMMKQKMNSMFKQKQIRKYKMRKPTLHKILQQFKSNLRVQQPPAWKQTLKNSQRTIEHIKINSRKRLDSDYSRTASRNSRPKFISMDTSKPTQVSNYFPTFEDFIEGKYNRIEETFVGIDIGKIDSYFNTLITEPNLNNRRVNNRQNMEYASRQSFAWTMLQSNSKTEYFKRSKMRVKSTVNPNQTFLKSEQSSKKIITEMKTFYSSKKLKNNQCDEIVGYLKKDRPLTSNIRRKNYNIIGRSHVNDLSRCRQNAEQQRLNILNSNYHFYISVLKLFEHCRAEDIRPALAVINRLKGFFESEYILRSGDVEDICQGDTDPRVAIIKDKMIQFAQKARLLTDNQEDFEIL